MGQFGEELRRERESRGVALETISERTKVITRYLTALEDEKFEVLPGGILSKGIVRGYARTVGLDEAVWVERFVTASRENGQTGEGDWSEFVQNVGKSRDRWGNAKKAAAPGWLSRAADPAGRVWMGGLAVHERARNGR